MKFRAYLNAFSKMRLPIRSWIPDTVSFSCLVTAWPLRASTVKECVVAGIMINATTVMGEPAAWSRWFNPVEGWKKWVHAYHWWQLANERRAIRTAKSFDEHVNTLITVFITSSNEEVEGVAFQVPIIVTIKVTSNKIVDLLFADSVQVLEFVHSGEFDNIQTIW